MTNRYIYAMKDCSINEHTSEYNDIHYRALLHAIFNLKRFQRAERNYAKYQKGYLNIINNNY